MRDLLLGGGDDDDVLLRQLADVVAERLDEGRGEVVFDLGFEHNGDSLGLSRAEWAVAYGRLQAAAAVARADCQLLLSRNVGGDADTAKSKDADCTGKVMIRQVPATVEDVIETRIAVVGNGQSAGRVECARARERPQS